MSPTGLATEGERQFAGTHPLFIHGSIALESILKGDVIQLAYWTKSVRCTRRTWRYLLSTERTYDGSGVKEKMKYFFYTTVFWGG